MDIYKFRDMPSAQRKAYAQTLTAEQKAEMRRRIDEAEAKEAGASQALPTVVQPGEAQPTGPLEYAKEFGAAVGQPYVDLVTGLINLAGRGASKAVGAENPPQALRYKIPVGDTYKSAKALGTVAGIAAPIFVPGAGLLMPELAAGTKGAQALTKLIPALGKKLNNKIAKYGAKAADIAATGAGYGAAYGANDQNNNLAKEGAKGAGINALATAIFHHPSAILERKLRNIAAQIKEGKMGGLSPEEFQQVQHNIPEDLPVDLGTAIESPQLSEDYRNNIATKAPMLASSKAQKVIQNEENTLQNTINNLRDTIPDAEIAAVREIEAKYLQNHAESKREFEDVIQEAQNAGINIGNPINIGGYEIGPQALKTTAQKFLERIARKEKTGLPSTHISGTEKNMLENMINPTEGRTLADLQNTRSHFLEMADKHAFERNKELASMYDELANAADQDLSTALKESGNKDLYHRLLKARETFKEKVVPYRDKFIQKLISKKKSPLGSTKRLISAEPDMQAVFNELPSQNKSALLERYLNPKGDLTTAAKFLTRYKNLPESERNRLFTSEQRAMFTRLEKSHQMAKESRALIRKPETGVKAFQLMKQNAIPLIAAGATELADFSALGNKHPLLAPIIGGLLAASIQSKYAKGKVNKMTSPALRKAYAEQKVEVPEMLKNLAKLSGKTGIYANSPSNATLGLSLYGEPEDQTYYMQMPVKREKKK